MYMLRKNSKNGIFVKQFCLFFIWLSVIDLALIRWRKNLRDHGMWVTIEDIIPGLVMVPMLCQCNAKQGCGVDGFLSDTESNFDSDPPESRAETDSYPGSASTSVKSHHHKRITIIRAGRMRELNWTNWTKPLSPRVLIWTEQWTSC